jgi:alkanesulfonate monooxygenase SsuD/methylene tetrahydromethanopterin reductase-like flavin-dependent oxidoreductase (luciferase family)
MQGRFLQDGPRFKLGLFGYLHEGGNMVTMAPERWSAQWSDVLAMAVHADEAGLDFLLPYARWKGIPGAVHNRLHSFENLTAAAALVGHTRRIGLFATVHANIIHPIVAAKMITTIDHASGGRAGVNIVCGWNQADFDMFGIQQLPHDERYVQGAEWFEIWSRLVEGAAEPFDFDGKHFKNLRGVMGLPGSVQKPRPVVINAAYSPAGRDFAVRTSDYLLTNIDKAEDGVREMADVRARAERAGRQTPIEVIMTCYVVCRETRAEADAFHRYYAEEMADEKGVDYWIAGRRGQGIIPDAIWEMRARIAAGNGSYPLVGSPQDVADRLIEVAELGYGGAALSFLNYDDVPFVVERVVPILEKAGLRDRVSAKSGAAA